MLARIAAQKELEVKTLMANHGLMEQAPRSVLPDLCGVFARTPGQLAVIAEIKKASPSRGVICENFEPLKLADAYVENGAAVLSVLTDQPFFQGSPDIFRAVRAKTALPMLRKDFVIHELQLYETLALGADLVLLIAALHEYERLLVLNQKCCELGLIPLVEVHNREELKKALDLPVQMIGVNNRDLHDFSVDIRTSLSLAAHIPDSFIKVSESGIKTPSDIKKLAEHGFHAALIGETLVSDPDPGGKLKEMIHYEQC